MRPTVMPDKYIGPDDQKVTLGAPVGLEDKVGPVEVKKTQTNLGGAISLIISLEDGDLETLQENGGRIWLTFYDKTIPVFSIDPVEIEPE